ncbi:MAG: LysR family transcriptional regulator [Chroococcidiopsidaceae cyanobacterium CP_BM_ER_R8_30]|nr:LysR family transcriptional regulator [Chroococcidiopsidaceae cyanobacterium CP_BM_ER_R8_30]
MEVYQIKVFLEVAKHLSFTEATKSLNLTQPGVSAKIKCLEAELGIPLFHRLGRKIQLTEAGQFLFQAGPRLIETENQLLQGIQDIKKRIGGTLRIGCSPAIAEGWLSDILFKYRKQYPDIQLQCNSFNSAKLLYQAITDSQIDLGISEINFEGIPELFTTTIGSIQYALFLSSQHPLAKHNWLSLKALRNHPWVLPPPNFSNRLVLETRLVELDLSLDDFPLIETVDTVGLMRNYILDENYLSFASSLEFKLECQSGLLISIPLQEFALPSDIFLLSRTPLNPLGETDSASFDQRSQSNSPAQAFTEFVQSLSIQSNHLTQENTLGVNIPSQPRSMSLQSPTFLHSAPSHRPETLILSIGVQNSTIAVITAGLIMQRLSLLEHFLPKQGRYSTTQYQIRWCNFPTGAPILDGLQSGQLDIGILGDYPLLLSAAHRDDITNKAGPTRLVSFVSVNPDGSCNALVVPTGSKFRRVEDLQGRSIAVPFNSLAHGRVLRLLQTTNLLTDVQLTFPEHIDPTQLLDQPIQLADGYAHFAPFHNIACGKGRFRYLLDNELENLPSFYGVAVSQVLADQHPEIVIAYLRALAGAQYWYDTTPGALPLISQWTDLEADIISLFGCSYLGNQSRRFFSEMTIHSDWLDLHIARLSLIPDHEYLQKIDLENWIQAEFLQYINALI